MTQTQHFGNSRDLSVFAHEVITRAYLGGSTFLGLRRAVGGRRGSIGTRDQHRDIEAVSNLIDGLAKQEVADHAVTVRTDDEQVGRGSLQISDDEPGAIGAVQQNG